MKNATTAPPAVGVRAHVAALEKKVALEKKLKEGKKGQPRGRGRSNNVTALKNAPMPALVFFENQVWVKWTALKLWIGASLGNENAQQFRNNVAAGESWQKYGWPRKTRFTDNRTHGQGLLPCDQ